MKLLPLFPCNISILSAKSFSDIEILKFQKGYSKSIFKTSPILCVERVFFHAMFIDEI